MQTLTPCSLRHFAELALFMLLVVSMLAAEAQTITLKDWTGRGFAPDLVNYTIPAPADGGKGVRVLDMAGASLPVQLTPGAKGQATLSFVAAIAPNGTAVYTIRTDGQTPAAPTAVSATREGETLVLANQSLAVRVPAPREKTFAPPVTADTLPAPVLAFRGPDGAWRGAGAIVHREPVKALHITQSANGPVFTEIRYRLDYAGGGYYAATIRVTDQAPFAQVTEEYDLGVAKNAHYWQLDLSKGWQPDAAEHMSVAGQGYSPLVYPTLAEEAKTATSGPNVGADFPGGDGAPTYCIHHDSCWGSRYVSYYGIHRADARKANPDAYPLVIVAPLHKGAWRRPNSIPVYVKDGDVRVRFPMDVAPISWQNEPASDVSPFSCHEHDPSLPVSYGRRVWALVLAKPTMLVNGYGEGKTLGIGYAVRNLYGTVGLDRYKDFILTWPDGNATYPRVFITPDEVKKYRAAVQDDPNFPLLPMIKNYYWFTGEAETAKKEVPGVHNWLAGNINYIITCLSIHHHQTLAAYGEPLGHTESVLSWPDLPATDRAAIRARLALLAYLLVEPDVTSAGDGSHHGNPNMGISRLSDRSNVIALIPDHPMHLAWRDYVGMFTDYKQGSFMAPEGGWFEYGASYHMHGYGKIERGLMGLFSSGAPQAEQMYAYHRADYDYFLNLLSPVDPRYGSRTIPGSANSPVGNSPHYLQAMGTVADRDPAFAANLRWAWENNGRMISTGGDAITIPAMVRPDIAAKEPQLTSRIYPGYGVIFRAHQDDNETCLFLRSGYLWSHWNQDQGNLALYAKGAVLLPSQPYQYGGPKDKNFPDKNFIHFGSPANDMPHAWPDSNILEAHFGPSVDYAWSSTGYPEWFINPGYQKGFGNPRELVDGLGQQQGAFTWDRQIAFLKGATGKSPNYFVIRDSMNGAGKLASWFNLSLLGHKENVQVTGSKVAVDTEWPTKLDILFPGRTELPFEMREDNLLLALGPYNRIRGNQVAGRVVSRDWLDKDGKPAVCDGRDGANAVAEQHVLLRLQSAPGQEIAWVLYPRDAGEATPTVTQLAPGVTKIVTSESTDYVFLSTTPLNFKGEGVEFAGRSGAVRVAKDGKATLILSAGPGKVGYKAHLINSAVPFEKIITAGKKTETLTSSYRAFRVPAPPAGAQPVAEGVTKATVDGVLTYVAHAPAAIEATDGNVRLHTSDAMILIGKEQIRFIVPTHDYAQLSVGAVGVRGVGPFDLTFTPDGITGNVDGDIRTLVTTWPEQITRPMFRLDKVRWYAGFADEHSITKGTTTPQFSLAFGVSAGAHDVKISEWEWPTMPLAPAQALLPKP